MLRLLVFFLMCSVPMTTVGALDSVANVTRYSASKYYALPAILNLGGNISTASNIACCHLCSTSATCRSVNFFSGSNVCQLSGLDYSEIHFYMDEHNYCTVYSKVPTTTIPTTTAGTTIPLTTTAGTAFPPTTTAGTTMPPTTTAGTTMPPTTAAGTTMPPTTTAGTTMPPTTTAGTTMPPTTAAGTTIPPTTAAGTTIPPTTNAGTAFPPTTAAGTTMPSTTTAGTTMPPTTTAGTAFPLTTPFDSTPQPPTSSDVPTTEWPGVWWLMFRGTPKINTSVYEAWVNGAYITSGNIQCMDLFTNQQCYQHFRNETVDNWKNFGVFQVRYSLYDAVGTELLYVIFAGTTSNHINWFSADRRLASSYKAGLATVDTFEHFSMEGDGAGRTFLIQTISDGCELTKGFTYVLESGSSGCIHDEFGSFPMFPYSKHSKYFEDFWHAEVMAIHVKFTD